MKGIVLAGGNGTRLHPLTRSVSKQLMPVYDKPMIYYPISVLMLAGITDILIVTKEEDQSAFKRLLGDGSEFGVRFTYAIQDKPRGLAHALIVAEEFLDNSPFALILGDNIFYGHGLPELLAKATRLETGAEIFAYQVADPTQYGVVSFTADGQVLSIEEKPRKPQSDYVVTGLYFYDSSAVSKAKSLKPSARGELEITDLNKLYLEEGTLKANLMGRGYAWLDAGSHDSLLEAGQFIASIEERQGMKIACLEEIGYRLGLISDAQLLRQARALKNTSYGAYLEKIARSAS
ncbi:glucose-1-phosphate thymidylyltransferase [Henriciella mobilis]|uniref:glucose-1-phosphate thymidylyltransferase RfbA n=1 Tax=Henriciella mobilis TaxID=2305467 RepID=UPI000E670739|nr:glucose-1-phosphate thymidylyltransferase RfbA [Henriciella mobilis]RIJ17135.1 glucose-1-phosphate thymidylyltransferase [Henriciella mobilis]RIJ22742.1 glucose-1-phosphate thymidylyltransferase [Henriciella mobilis]